MLPRLSRSISYCQKYVTVLHYEIQLLFHRSQISHLCRGSPSVCDCRNLDPEKILAEISKEQNFDVTYVDIDEKTEDGDVQCLVQETSNIPKLGLHRISGLFYSRYPAGQIRLQQKIYKNLFNMQKIHDIEIYRNLRRFC